MKVVEARERISGPSCLSAGNYFLKISIWLDALEKNKILTERAQRKFEQRRLAHGKVNASVKNLRQLQHKRRWYLKKLKAVVLEFKNMEQLLDYERSQYSRGSILSSREIPKEVARCRILIKKIKDIEHENN